VNSIYGEKIAFILTDVCECVIITAGDKNILLLSLNV